ncbi:hypothetical protein P9112_012015 [Eukaryota sp. TZLM1-RC]
MHHKTTSRPQFSSTDIFVVGFAPFLIDTVIIEPSIQSSEVLSFLQSKVRFHPLETHFNPHLLTIKVNSKNEAQELLNLSGIRFKGQKLKIGQRTNYSAPLPPSDFILSVACRLTQPRVRKFPPNLTYTVVDLSGVVDQKSSDPSQCFNSPTDCAHLFEQAKVLPHLASVTMLRLNKNSIQTLSFLKDSQFLSLFTNLESLTLDKNYITDPAHLAFPLPFPKLKTMSIKENPIAVQSVIQVSNQHHRAQIIGDKVPKVSPHPTMSTPPAAASMSSLFQHMEVIADSDESREQVFQFLDKWYSVLKQRQEHQLKTFYSPSAACAVSLDSLPHPQNQSFQCFEYVPLPCPVDQLVFCLCNITSSISFDPRTPLSVAIKKDGGKVRVIYEGVVSGVADVFYHRRFVLSSSGSTPLISEDVYHLWSSKGITDPKRMLVARSGLKDEIASGCLQLSNNSVDLAMIYFMKEFVQGNVQFNHFVISGSS